MTHEYATLLGAAAIPTQWRQTLLSCRPHPANPNAAWPRPEAFWPVDALILAARLLMRGREKQ